MPVRSKRLWDRVAVSNTAATTLYTADSGETVLVKTITVVNPSATLPATVYIGRPAPGVGSSGNLFKVTVPVDEVVQIYTWIVLQPGNPMQARVAGTNTVVRCSGFGAELEGVAD